MGKRGYLPVLTAVLLLAGAGCSKTPQVDFGADKDTPLTELSQARIADSWKEGTRAFREVVDLEAWCMLRGVFRGYESRDPAQCEQARKECLATGRVRLPRDTFEDWQAALGAACTATLGHVETCINDGLKNLNKGLSSLSCRTPPQQVDAKLQVPESCRNIEQTCILPVISHYGRRQ